MQWLQSHNFMLYVFQYKLFVVCFNNISVILWRSVLLVDEIGEPGENHWSVASHWQTLSHNVVQQNVNFWWCYYIGQRNMLFIVIAFSKITYIMHKETCQWSIKKSLQQQFASICIFSRLHFTATEKSILQYKEVLLWHLLCFLQLAYCITCTVFKNIYIILLSTIFITSTQVDWKIHCIQG